MTAEVAIMNKSAVVVAADSALTIGKGKKIYRSVNKIFAVCENPAVGIMIYGNAMYCGIPYETLIKIFRKENSTLRVRTVKDVFINFKSFLKNGRFFSAEQQDYNLLQFLVCVIDRIFNIYKRKISSADRIRKRQLVEFFEQSIEEFNEKIIKMNDEIEFNFKNERNFKVKCIDFITKILDSYSDFEFNIPLRLKRKLCDSAWLTLHSPFMSDYSSGIVFFGFGEDELFPSIVSCEIDSCCFDEIRSIPLHEVSGEKAHIIPFADRDDMDTLLQGLDRRFQNFLSDVMDLSLKEVARRIIRSNFSLSEDEFSAIDNINSQIIKEIMNKSNKVIEKIVYEEKIEPLMRTVQNLPKEDMATLAEALIEVTALKKRVSSEVESVGGAVDVCVITKGDGLIWIKRKHYFDMDKNVHYLYNKLPLAVLSKTYP